MHVFPVGSELFHGNIHICVYIYIEGRTDGRTDVTKLIVKFSIFVKRPKALFSGNLQRRCTLQCSSAVEHKPTVQKEYRSI